MSDEVTKPKRKKGAPLTAKALEYCRHESREWFAGVVERRLPHTKTTVDLFGCIDLIVLDGKPGVLGVQVTSSAHVRDRVRKIIETCATEIDAWLAADGRIEVWGFSKRREAGGSRMLWCRDVTPITRQERGHGEEEERQRGSDGTGDGGRLGSEADGGQEAARDQGGRASG